MYCKNCGAQLDDCALICNKCGVATDKFYTDKNAGGACAHAENLSGANPSAMQIVPADATEHTAYDYSAAPAQNNAAMYAAQPQSEKRNTNIYGIVGFSISLVCTLFGIFLFINVLGIIFSAIGINKSGKDNYGRALAIAGLVVSVCMLIIWTIISIVMHFALSFIYFMILILSAGAA